MTTEVKEKQRRSLSAYEQETIINFNKEESIAYIFTYEKTWQKHLEQRLGLKPVMDNAYGGKEYQLPKKLIRPPRVPLKLPEKVRQERAKRLAGARWNSHVSAKTH